MLTLPVSTVIRLLGKKGMVGSLGNLYESVEGMDASYIQPNKNKDTLLKPVAPLPAGYSTPPLLCIEEAPTAEKRFFRCGLGCSYMSDDPLAVCPSCKGFISTAMNYVTCAAAGVVQQAADSTGEGGGFVKGVVTYMIVDDLVVKPMSTISSITLLSHFNIKDILTLEEKVVTLGMKEAVMLLKASLETDKVLTNVFLNLKY